MPWAWNQETVGRQKAAEKALEEKPGGQGPLSLKELQPLFPGVGAGSAQVFWRREDRGCGWVLGGPPSSAHSVFPSCGPAVLPVNPCENLLGGA